MLLDDSKLHGDEKVTGCTVGRLYLLHKMLHSNLCWGQKKAVTTVSGAKGIRPVPELSLTLYTSLRLVNSGTSSHYTEKQKRAG